MGSRAASARVSTVQANSEAHEGYIIDAWWRRLPERPATTSLIALCVLAYTATLVGAVVSSPDPFTTLIHSIWTLEGSESVLIRLGALELTHVWVDGEWWRVASAGLLHGFFIHLLLNLLALGSLGDWVEHAWGPWRTLLIFAASSVAGCLASLAWCESSLVVGASAGALGLAGALLVGRRFGSPTLQERLEPISSFSLASLILLCLILGAVVPWIAQAGHIGGLALGVVLGATMVARRLIGRIVGSLAACTSITILSSVGAAPPWPAEVHQFMGLRAISERDTTTALKHFQAALEFDPHNAQVLNTMAYQMALDSQELDYAESLALRALALEPTNPNFLDTLGWILCQRGSPQPAVTLLRAAMFLSREPVPEIAGHIPACASDAVGGSGVPRETSQ